MLQPGRYDWDQWRQDDEPTTFVFRDDAGNPLDLSGASIFLQIRRSEGAAGDPIISLSSEGANANGSTIAVTDVGTVEVAISLLDLAAFPATDRPSRPAEYAYDIVVVWADGKGAPYLTGKFILHEGTTVRT